MKTAVVEISLKSVIKIIILLIGLFFVWKIRFILVSLFFSYILMIGFAQLADYLQAKGFSKSLAVTFSYSIMIFIIAILIFFIVPPLILQLSSFIEKLPVYMARLDFLFSSNSVSIIKIEDITNLVSKELGVIISTSFNLIFNTFNALLGFLTVAVLSFYLLIEREAIKSNLFRLFPNLPKERVTNLAHKIEKQVGSWLKGQLLLMIIIFIVTYIGLTLLRVEYALPLALLAGLLEAVPIIGPILSAIPAVLITFTISPLAALGVVVLYILIQQLENNFLVPKVMQGAIGINPLTTLLALLIGANLFGILGAVLAVPLAAIIQVIIFDVIEHQDFK